MDCIKAKSLLSEYLDRRLTAEEVANLEAHLQDCPGCAAELASLRQTVSLLSALPTVPIPRPFTIPVMAAEPAKVPWWQAWSPFEYLRAAATVCGAMLAIVIALQVVLASQYSSLPAYRTAPSVQFDQGAPNIASEVRDKTEQVTKATTDKPAADNAPAQPATPAVGAAAPARPTEAAEKTIGGTSAATAAPGPMAAAPPPAMGTAAPPKAAAPVAPAPAPTGAAPAATPSIAAVARSAAKEPPATAIRGEAAAAPTATAISPIVAATQAQGTPAAQETDWLLWLAAVLAGVTVVLLVITVVVWRRG
jgi:predicted anti-sigma-YlaC factor YlaD